MKLLLRIGIVLSAAIGGLFAQETFRSTVQPVLAKHCFSCHSEKLAAAKLNLEALSDARTAEAQPAVWEKVREKLSAGKMPPPGQPAVPRADLAAVTNWIDTILKPAENRSEPGRVMARRLNRVEYNNTIRDLLGVPIRPADEFPVDDSGYGFDNIADVLTVSPMLMEKYMAAANRVSRLAVYGETVPEKPARLVRLLNRRSPDAADFLSTGGHGAYLPYSMRGAMYGTWNFPVEAEYEFRLRIANFRSDPKLQRFAARNDLTVGELAALREASRKAAPPRKLVLTVDGAPVITTVIEGTTGFEYDRGDLVGRMRVKAGERALRASFPELADLDDPRQNINPDKRRALFVDYLEIAGPFNASQSPPESYGRIFVCKHVRGGHKRECGPIIIENLLRRAYRRPVTPQEVEAKLHLVTLAQKEGDPFEEGIRLALEAVLASPDFLFRIERDPKRPNERSSAINDYELASRLSYFLWSSMPDDELLRAAAGNTLHRPGVLKAQVRRMLADKRAANLVDNFAAQWLQLRTLGRTKPDPARFPTVDDDLLDAMRRETTLFVEAVLREDRSILDFIDAPFTFVNGPLARHYGIPGVDGEEFRRIDLDGEKRSGLLTQGSILTVSSYPTRTSPPVRGKWVLENFLGAAPPPPPPDVPVLDESNLGTTVSMRERLEQHRKDPACSACHNLMDPIGFGLESYDAVGSWRTHDGKVPFDTSGVLPDGKSFKGAKDLKQILRSQSDSFTRNLTEKLLTFALGRGLEPFDRTTVDAIARDVERNGYRFSALVLGIVNSKPFQMRSAEGEKL